MGPYLVPDIVNDVSQTGEGETLKEYFPAQTPSGWTVVSAATKDILTSWTQRQAGQHDARFSDERVNDLRQHVLSIHKQLSILAVHDGGQGVED